MGDESLDVTERRFRWDRLTPTFQNGILRAATHSFTPLTVAHTGDYRCTNTITSPYLTSTRTRTVTITISVTGMFGSCIGQVCGEGGGPGVTIWVHMKW